jgi:hypothetical protein
MRNLYLARAKRILRKLIQYEKDPLKRSDLRDALSQMEQRVYSYEQWIKDAKMMGIRNPAFDGDEIGYPEDDFDDDDDKHRPTQT